MYNCTTSSKYFFLQNPHNNPAIVAVLNKEIFQICSTLIFQNTNLYLSIPLAFPAIFILRTLPETSIPKKRLRFSILQFVVHALHSYIYNISQNITMLVEVKNSLFYLFFHFHLRFYFFLLRDTDFLIVHIIFF